MRIDPASLYVPAAAALLGATLAAVSCRAAREAPVPQAAPAAVVTADTAASGPLEEAWCPIPRMDRLSRQGRLSGIYTRVHPVAWLEAMPGDSSAWVADSASDALVLQELPEALAFCVALQFNNGHSCELDGRARPAAGGYVFTDTTVFEGQEQPCTLRFSVTGDRINLLDPGYSCQNYCGMRGTLHEAWFARSSRQ